MSEDREYSEPQYRQIADAALRVYQNALINSAAEVPSKYRDEKIKDALDELCRLIGVKALAK